MMRVVDRTHSFSCCLSAREFEAGVVLRVVDRAHSDNSDIDRLAINVTRRLVLEAWLPASRLGPGHAH